MSKAKIMAGNSRQMATGEVRLCYVWLNAPRRTEEGGEQYEVCLLIPKTDKETVQLLSKIVQTAAQEKGLKGNYRRPLRDGDTDRPEQEEFKGMYFCNAKSQRKPIMMDTYKMPLTDEAIYSGMYASVLVTAYGYDHNANKGVGLAIDALVKTRDGEVLSGGTVDVNEAFGDLFDTDTEAADSLFG